ncbi:hypothetical protein [Candidatus Uabimicrobium sp. HlEnr_7]|uniref:hypothetical protein n=1 Tax=Candidatus Uabimicrobium helgolandensis TaxID=3095367 RepID=UPI00355648FC
MEKAFKKHRASGLLYLSILTILLNIVTITYIYEQSYAFREFIHERMAFLTPVISQVISRYSYFYEIDMQYVVFLLWGIIFLSSVIGFIETPQNPLLPNPLNLFLTIAICTVFCLFVTVVYYWPYDTIRIGSLFEFYRGNAEEFSNSVIYIVNILTIIYLYVFIINRLYLWLQQKDKIQVRET